MQGFSLHFTFLKNSDFFFVRPKTKTQFDQKYSVEQKKQVIRTKISLIRHKAEILKSLKVKSFENKRMFILKKKKYLISPNFPTFWCILGKTKADVVMKSTDLERDSCKLTKWAHLPFFMNCYQVKNRRFMCDFCVIFP